MTKLLLTQYRLEFEHTNISLEDLVAKYSLDIEDLKDYEEWTKGGPPPAPTVLHSQELVTSPIELTNEEKIKEFKTLALDRCLHFIKSDVRFAVVKEFKDIVAIVDTLDKKSGIDTNTTINVLVQNIQEKFVDDC